MAERMEVTQELCRKVQIMLGGAKAAEVADLLGISKSTVSRIKAAEFDAVKYAVNLNIRRLDEVMRKTRKTGQEEPEPAEEKAELPGQLEMELPMSQPQKSEAAVLADVIRENRVKMAAFQAEKITDIMEVLCLINTKLTNIDDKLGQILRRGDKA